MGHKKNALAVGIPPFLFYSFIFLFHAAERSYAGTAAGLDGSVLKRVN
ncbi:MAG: hypothetical protein K2K74_07070 [Lachnospiraceae bacterium]|nr:hypothetical protein [Lachnospiraceae bacterium]